MKQIGQSWVPLTVMLLLLSASPGARAQRDGSLGSRAFEKMKSALAGKWQASTAQGKRAFLHYELVSHKSALMERFIDEGSDEFTNMITLYHMDGDHLMLTHYCGEHNQPRMRARTIAPDLKTLTFDFFDGTNMKSPNDEHMHSVTYKFTDADHITTIWRLHRDGKEVFVEVLDFTRIE